MLWQKDCYDCYIYIWSQQFGPPSLCFFFFFNILDNYHWSTQAGLWGGSALFLDNICQRQPWGNSVPDHFCPDRRCEWASCFHWVTYTEKSRYQRSVLRESKYQRSVLRESKSWGHRRRSCALCLMCFHGVRARRLKETDTKQTWACIMAQQLNGFVMQAR
jgi:hypothetical protein